MKVALRNDTELGHYERLQKARAEAQLRLLVNISESSAWRNLAPHQLVESLESMIGAVDASIAELNLDYAIRLAQSVHDFTIRRIADLERGGNASPQDRNALRKVSHQPAFETGHSHLIYASMR